MGKILSLDMSRLPLLGLILFLATHIALGQQLLFQQKLGIDPSQHNPHIALFGTEVLVQGDRLFVGASNMVPKSITQPDGAVLCYSFDSLNQKWKLDQTLYNPLSNQSGSQFGQSIAVDDSTLVIGAPGILTINGQLNYGVGAVFIYTLDQNGLWQYKSFLTANRRSRYMSFGHDVAISGEYMAIACPNDNFNSQDSDSIVNSGAIYIYKRNSIGEWNFREKLVDPYRDQSARFGYRVDLKDDWLVAGAPNEYLNENNQDTKYNAGAAFVFRKESDGYFYYRQKLMNEQRYQGTRFAHSVSLGVHGLLIGSQYNSDYTPGAELYTFDSTLGTWKRTQEFWAKDVKGNRFGMSVAQDDSIIVIGTISNLVKEGNLQATGAFEAYKKVNGTWVYFYTIFNPNHNSKDEGFGSNISLYNGLAVAGTQGFDFDADSVYVQNTGTVSIFKLRPCTTKITTLYPDPCDLYESPTGKKKKNSEHFQDTIVENGGCLDIYDINLNIRKSTFSTVDSTICGFFESSKGIRVFAKDTQWVEFYINRAGCDSIHSIKLRNGKPNNDIHRMQGRLISQEEDASYQWLDCYYGYQAITGDTNPVFHPRRSGLYTVQLTKGLCIDTPTCFYLPPEFVDHPLNDTVRLYPNPSNGPVILDLGEEGSKAEVYVYDYTGKLILIQEFTDTQIGEIILPDDPRVYLLFIHLENGEVLFRKIIKI